MSKYVNRQKRRARTINEVLELIKQDRVDEVYEEYVFRFGVDYLIEENSPEMLSWFGEKYRHGSYDLVKKRLLA